MKHFWILALALVSASAISAVAVASASAALPLWLKGGKPLTEPVKFDVTSGASKLETTGGTKLECEKDKATGQAEGDRAVLKVKFDFEGCKEGQFPFAKCTTVGDPEGTILTEELLGELVLLNLTELGHLKAGLLLTGPLKVFAVFTCAFGVVVTVTGEVIGEVTPIDEEVEKWKLIYKEAAGKLGVQDWRFVDEAGEEKLLTLTLGLVTSDKFAITSEDTVEWLPAGTKVKIDA